MMALSLMWLRKSALLRRGETNFFEKSPVDETHILEKRRTKETYCYSLSLIPQLDVAEKECAAANDVSTSLL